MHCLSPSCLLSACWAHVPSAAPYPWNAFGGPVRGISRPPAGGKLSEHGGVGHPGGVVFASVRGRPPGLGCQSYMHRPSACCWCVSCRVGTSGCHFQNGFCCGDPCFLGNAFGVVAVCQLGLQLGQRGAPSVRSPSGPAQCERASGATPVQLGTRRKPLPVIRDTWESAVSA